MTKLLRAPSMIAVAIALVLWMISTFVFPASSAWLFDLQPALSDEGRIEIFENLLVLACALSWIGIARRVRDRRRPLVIACAMIAQLALILVEELDWGRVFGLPPVLPQRNLRMTLRSMGLLSPGMDPDAFVAFLVVFMLSPLVPSARYRAWWEGAAPVRAERSDAIAAVVAMGVFLGSRLALHERASFELLQSCEYLVLAAATWRIARATRRA